MVYAVKLESGMGDLELGGKNLFSLAEFRDHGIKLQYLKLSLLAQMHRLICIS